ncbi:CHAP domain [Trypanosoma melophagium]|uniref:CHAP domain n=1 Tax=Trypanosoma melophagium TaxID=715481 RepID=UPI00351A7C8A|nr:CHAP domain [Trypanosoma melophagium]
MQWNNQTIRKLNSSSSPQQQEKGKEEELKELHGEEEEFRIVPLHGICGYAPGGIPAYSNGTSSTFTNQKHYHQHKKHKPNKQQQLFTGYKWQCVEFARRYLLHSKGLALPSFDFAAHIIHLRYVYDIYTGARVPCRLVPQGGRDPPTLHSLIIYPGSYRNIVGHVGVITYITVHSVGVADQNRYFHHWGEKPFSAEFALECVDGCYYVRDPEVECRGWIIFPEEINPAHVNILQQVREGIEEKEREKEEEKYLFKPPSLGCCVRMSYMLKHLWSWCTGRESMTFHPG